MRVAFFGLGRLGLPLALLMKNAGHEVIGIDKDQTVVDCVNRGQVPPRIVEPGLDTLLERVKLAATTDASKALEDADASVILVPTPSGEDHMFIPDAVIDCCYSIGCSLDHAGKSHLVVIVSTLMPDEIKPCAVLVSAASLRELGKNLHVVYSPEFVMLGDVLMGMRYPDVQLLGVLHPPNIPGSFNLLHSYVYSVLPKRTVMGYWEAGLAKLVLNTSLSLKPTLAGIVATICATHEGADPDVVTSFIGSDPRIGSKLLRPGLHPSGPCLPRDVRALLAYTIKIAPDVTPPPLLAGLELHSILELHLYVELLRELKTTYFSLPTTANLGFIGVGYKPNVPATDESLPLKLAKSEIKEWELAYYDPVASLDEVECCLSIRELADRSDVLLLAYPDRKFAEELLEIDFRGIIIDPWRVFKEGELMCRCHIRMV